MPEQWLCLIDGQKIGPVKFSRLQQLAEAGRLRADDYVRPADQEQWLVAKNVPNLNLIPAPTPERAEAKPNEQPAKKHHSGTLPVAQQIVESTADASAVIAISPTPRGKPASGAIPKGNAVMPAPLGKAVSIAPKSDGDLPFIITKESAASSDEESSSRVRDKKKSNSMPLLIGGGAIAGILGVVLILVLSGVIDLSGNSEVASTTPQKKPTKLPPVVDEDGEEANPDAETGDEKKADAAPAKAAKGGAKSSKDGLLATVKQFRDITKVKNISLQPAKVSITGLWLSPSEKGEPYVAKAPDEGQQAVAKFLVVKIKIDNAAGAAPMNYTGWGDEAVLFDAADKPIIPLAPGGSTDRVAKQRIEPGGSLVDTLVFPLEDIEFEKLRLALPHETVGIKDSKSFGLELPRHALGRGLETQAADTASPGVSARVTGSEPGEIIDKTPAAEAVAKPNPAKPAAPKPMETDDEAVQRKAEEKVRLEEKMEKERMAKEKAKP
jgi:hypothetical protein